MPDGLARVILWRRRQCVVSLILLFLLLMMVAGAAGPILDRPVTFPTTLFVAFIHVFSLTWWLFAGAFTMIAIAAGKGWLDRFLKIVTIGAWAWTILALLGWFALARAPHSSELMRTSRSVIARSSAR